MADPEPFLPRTMDKIVAVLLGMVTLLGVAAAAVRKWVSAPIKLELKELNQKLEDRLKELHKEFVRNLELVHGRIGLEPGKTVKTAIDGVGTRMDLFEMARWTPLVAKVERMDVRQEASERERNQIRDELMDELRSNHSKVMEALQGKDGLSDRIARLEERTRNLGDSK